MGVAFTDIIDIKASRWQRLILALSAANLNLLWQWRETIFASPADLFYLPLITAYDLLGLLVVLVLLALAFYGLITVANNLAFSGRYWILQILLALFATGAILHLYRITGETLATHPAHFWSFVTVFLILLGYPSKIVLSGLAWLFFLSSPLALLFPAHAIAKVAVLDTGVGTGVIEAQHVVTMTSKVASPRPRIVWLLFDELDQRVLNDHLADLPNFRALTAQSLTATKALPAGGSTLRAVPALLLGQRFVASQAVGPATLLVTPYGGKGPRAFDGKETFVARLARESGKVVMNGWSMPLCRLFGGIADSCNEELLASMRAAPGTDLPHAISQWLHSLYPLRRRQNAHAALSRLITNTITSAGSADFLYTHLPIPHAPSFWHTRDATMGAVAIEFAYTVTGKLSYLTNLHLADAILGEILTPLRQSAHWANTAIIVTSDHGWRQGGLGYRGTFDSPQGEWGNPGDVPIIIHLPGQKAPWAAGEQLDTVRLGEVTIGIWEGTIRTPAEAVAVLREVNLMQK